MKKVMIIEDLRTPSIFGRDLRRPEAVVTLGCTMRFDIDVNMWNFSEAVLCKSFNSIWLLGNGTNLRRPKPGARLECQRRVPN